MNSGCGGCIAYVQSSTLYPGLLMKKKMCVLNIVQFIDLFHTVCVFSVIVIKILSCIFFQGFKIFYFNTLFFNPPEICSGQSMVS